MNQMIPDFLLAQSTKGKTQGILKALVLNVDVEGFTALTQELMRHSQAGGKVIADTINSVFFPAMEATETKVGFLGRISGDTFTAVFPENQLIQTVSAAIAIRDTVMNHSRQTSAWGKFKLEARMGIGLGNVEWQIVKGRNQPRYWFSGDAVSEAKKAQTKANSNQIVASKVLCEESEAIVASDLDTDFQIVNELALPGSDRNQTMPVQESNTGQYHPGCGEFSEIQDMQERALGDKHPFTLNVLNQLAEYHWEKGDRELALQYYQTAARKLKQISPPEYPYLSVSLCGIGHYYYDKADYENALEYYLCALLPENSPLELKYFYDLDALSQISSIYLKQGKRFEAMVFCNKELALISASVGDDHIANAGSLVNLGNIFLGMGKPQKAMKSLNKALKLRKAHLGDEHILTREVYELVLQIKAQMNCHKVAMNY